MADATRKLQIIIDATDNASKIIRGMSSNIGSLVKNATAGAATISGSVGLLGKSFIEAGSTLEQARISFNTLIGDSERAGKALDEMGRFAARTPFDLPQVLEGSKRLLAMGTSVDKLLPTLKMLGDVAAGVGMEKLPQLILAFGQIQAKGRLMGTELRQLTEAGFNLADAMGISNEKLEELVADKAVKFSDVEEAFRKTTSEGGRFFNLMENQSKTFGGVMSNLRDNFFRFGAAVVGVSTTGEIVAGQFFDRISQAAQKLLEVLDQVIPKVADVMNAFLENEVAVAAVIGALLGLLTPLVVAFVMLIAPALLLMVIFAGLAAGIMLIIQGIQAGNPWIIGLTAALVTLGVIILASVIPAFIAWAVAAISAAIATFLALLPIIVIITIIGVVVGLFALAWKKNWGDIQGKTKAVVDWVRNTAWPIVKNILGLIKQAVKNLAQKWIDRFNAIKGAVEAVINAISNLINKAKEIGSGIAGKFGLSFQHGGFIPGSFSQAVPAVLHGGERVIPRTGTDVNNRGAGGGLTINFNAPVNVDSEDRVNQLAETIIRMIGRQNELAAKGLIF